MSTFYKLLIIGNEKINVLKSADIKLQKIE